MARDISTKLNVKSRDLSPAIRISPSSHPQESALVKEEHLGAKDQGLHSILKAVIPAEGSAEVQSRNIAFQRQHREAETDVGRKQLLDVACPSALIDKKKSAQIDSKMLALLAQGKAVKGSPMKHQKS